MTASALPHLRGTQAESECPRTRPVRPCNATEVREAIGEEIGYPLDQILPWSLLLEDLGLDPFDVAEIVTALEKRFSLRVPDHVLSSLRTIADLERSVTARPTRRSPRGDERPDNL